MGRLAPITPATLYLGSYFFIIMPSYFFWMIYQSCLEKEGGNVKNFGPYFHDAVYSRIFARFRVDLRGYCSTKLYFRRFPLLSQVILCIFHVYICSVHAAWSLIIQNTVNYPVNFPLFGHLVSGLRTFAIAFNIDQSACTNVTTISILFQIGYMG